MVGGNLREPILDAERAAGQFIRLASEVRDPQIASEWALAAKNMAATVHSLIGAQQTARRG